MACTGAPEAVGLVFETSGVVLVAFDADPVAALPLLPRALPPPGRHRRQFARVDSAAVHKALSAWLRQARVMRGVLAVNHVFTSLLHF